MSWYETRPDDTTFYRRRAKLISRGGWWATARLAKLYSEPNKVPLVAVIFDKWPALVKDGALDGTQFEGVPGHYSIASRDELPRKVYKCLAYKWKRPHKIFISIDDVNKKGTAQVGTRCAIGSCQLNKRAKALGSYRRTSHVSL